MKKLIPLMLVLLMAFTLLVMPLSANQPLDELKQLAELAPAVAPLFIVIRTDDEFIDSLDAIFVDKRDDIAEQIGEPTRDVDLRDLLGEALGLDDEDESFETSIRPWLGGHVALFLPSAEILMEGSGDTPLTVVAPITDQVAAVAFLDSAYEFDIDFGDLEKIEQEDGSVLYNPTVSFLTPTLVTNDLLIIGDPSGVVLPGADARKLSSVDAFNAAVDALPESEYNALVYFDPQPLVELVAMVGPMAMGENWPDLDMDAIADSLGKMALGFTIMGERSLVMDFAQTGATMMAGAPLDLSLLDRVPADAVSVMQFNGMGMFAQNLLDQLAGLDAMWADMGLAEEMDLGALSFLTPGDIVTFLTLSVEGTLDINLEETLALMNGDLVTFSRPHITDSLLTTTNESGSLLVIDQPEAVAELVEKIATYVTRMYSGATYEDGTLSLSLEALLGENDLVAFDYIITATDDFLASGSARAVDALLNPGDSITGTAAYQSASGLFLSDPSLLAYLGGPSMRSFMEQLLSMEELNASAEDMEMVEVIFGLFDSAAITARHGETGTTARFTITLSE